MGQGPVAELFPEIWHDSGYVEAVNSLTDAQKQERAKVIDDLVAGMTQLDDTFFSRFEVAMKSGNPLLIEEMLIDTSHVFTAVATQLGFIKGEDNISTQACGPTFCIAVAAVVVVAANYVAVWHSAVATMVAWSWVATPGGIVAPGESQRSSLEANLMTLRVAQRLFVN